MPDSGSELELETIARVLDLVSHLGGPACTPGELEWAADIPAGKLLLEWLASQVSDDRLAAVAAVAATDTSSVPDLRSRTLQASASPIALYKEELDMCVAL